MPQAHRLGVAAHGHPAHDVLGSQLEQLESHLRVQCAVHTEEPVRELRPVGRCGHSAILSAGFVSAPADRVGTVPTPTTAPAETRPKLLLIDGHSVAYRAFYRPAGGELLHPNRTAHQRRLRLHLDADQRPARRGPTHLGVGFDVSRQTFRSEIYSRVQGDSLQEPGRVQRSARPGEGGAQRAEHRAPGEGGTRRTT